MAGGKAGIYIHIPFCIRKCPYCDFFSVAAADLYEAYAQALIRQIRSAGHFQADTVYFGGGTPSLFPAELLSRILKACRDSFELDSDSEITFEMNPATADLDKLCRLREAGFNRVSVGIQSTDPRVLSALGRQHTADEAIEALALVRQAQYANYSADLMLATPFSSPDSVKKSISDLIGAGVTHLSAYLLKIMPGTPFDLSPPPLPSDDEAADQYELVCEIMRGHGFVHYEISNFALPGRESRHNLKYWRLDDYYGFGPGAHSCVGRKRSSVPADLQTFIGSWQTEQPSFDCFSNDEGTVDGEDLIVAGLRTSGGIDLGVLEDEYGYVLDDRKTEYIAGCCRAGLVRSEGRMLSLTEKGFLVSNSILAELI